MFDGRWRTAVDRTTGPVGETLHRHGITADVLTATGLVSASATAVLVGSGHFSLAILFLIITGMHDLFDGPVAKAAGTASVRGAFFDSVTDRIADAVLMFGCAWYLLDRGDGHLALLPMGILAVTALVSYERAKAESLGLSAKGGLMERGERMFLLGVSFLSTVIFVPVLWILLALVSFTAALAAQVPAKPKPEDTEVWTPVPPIVTPGATTVAFAVPSPITVMFGMSPACGPSGFSRP